MCLLAVLGSQAIVVKCTAAMFFPYGGLIRYMYVRVDIKRIIQTIVNNLDQ